MEHCVGKSFGHEYSFTFGIKIYWLYLHEKYEILLLVLCRKVSGWRCYIVKWHCKLVSNVQNKTVTSSRSIQIAQSVNWTQATFKAIEVLFKSRNPIELLSHSMTFIRVRHHPGHEISTMFCYLNYHNENT